MGARRRRIGSSIVVVAAAAAVSLLSHIQLASATTTVAPARSGEDPAQLVDQVENSRFQFVGQISSENVLVRSGPGENHYATLRLNKGAEVTVVGMKFDWLKILPPEGSYSAISKDYVKLVEGTRTGTVTATNVRVRAAGNASNLKAMVQCQLDQGDEVEILGEEDEYYQIKPPAEAFLFVNQKFVTPIRQINYDPTARQQDRSRQQPPEGTFVKPEGSDTIVVGPAAPTTQPVNGGADGATARQPTTQPVRWDLAKIESEFDRLEDLVRDSATRRLDEQPIRDLIAGYDGLMGQQNLPLTMRQVANVRLLTLRAKLKSQEEYLSTRRVQDEADKRLAQLRAEREAVEQRMMNNVTTYTAVGTLQASTLQAGSGVLYRLTDPATGRTLCYVRGTKDPKFVTFVEKFVGVKGEITSDPQLSMKVIPATEIVAVDPQKVNKSIAAQLVPPSLVGNAGGERK